MQITVSRFAGFCGGVKRAYDMVMSLDMSKVRQPVFVLGDLVHNKAVIERIEKKGVAIISREDFKKATAREVGTLVITAHGDGPQIFQEAQKKGIDVLDTTCPNVVKAQRLAKTYAKRGNRVILIGDKEHKEVKGIFDWGNKLPQVISNLEEAKGADINSQEKTYLISQTTQDSGKVKAILEFLRNKFPQAEIEFINTICLATENRQEEIRGKAGNFDGVIVIGDKHSANSQRLFEIAKSVNTNTFFIQRADQLEKDKLVNFKDILITAGASTPNWLIKEVQEIIESWSS